MNIGEENSLVAGAISEAKTLWFEEIIRETEHYFQGEIQQDQRASWLLATNGVLVAVAGGLEVALQNKGNTFAQIILVLSLTAFALSSSVAVFTIMPFRGTHIWFDFLGNHYRRNKRLVTEQLIKERFRHNNDWSIEDYERRIIHHFRSHYLRFNRKAYGVLWSAIFLMIGLLLFLILGIANLV